jgi:hypothetical protein
MWLTLQYRHLHTRRRCDKFRTFQKSSSLIPGARNRKSTGSEMITNSPWKDTLLVKQQEEAKSRLQSMLIQSKMHGNLNIKEGNDWGERRQGITNRPKHKIRRMLFGDRKTRKCQWKFIRTSVSPLIAWMPADLLPVMMSVRVLRNPSQLNVGIMSKLY